MRAKYLIVPIGDDPILAETQSEVKAAIDYVRARTMNDVEEDILLYYAPDGFRQMSVKYEIEIAEMVSLATLEDRMESDFPSEDDEVDVIYEEGEDERRDEDGTQDGVLEEAIHFNSGEKGDQGSN